MTPLIILSHAGRSNRPRYFLKRIEAMAHSLNAPVSFRIPLKSLIRLGRPKEHLAFSIPLTWLGALVAAPALDSFSHIIVLIAVTIANLLVVTYAFMINDIADAPDDAQHPESAQRNPIARGEIPLKTAWVASYAILAHAGQLLLYVAVGFASMLLQGTSLRSLQDTTEAVEHNPS